MVIGSSPLVSPQKSKTNVKKKHQQNIICNDRGYDDNSIWAKFDFNGKANILLRNETCF